MLQLLIGKNKDKNISSSSLPDKDQILQIFSKINSLPSLADLAAKLHNLGSLGRKFSEQTSLDQFNGRSSQSTMKLLIILSATLAAFAPDALALLSQSSSPSSDMGKTKPCLHQMAQRKMWKFVASWRLKKQRLYFNSFQHGQHV